MIKCQFLKELWLVFREGSLERVKAIREFWKVRVAIAETRQAYRQQEELSNEISEDEYSEASAVAQTQEEFSKVVITDQLKSLCVKYMIPLPDSDSYVELGNDSKMYYLNSEAMASIKERVEIERKKRAEALRATLGLWIGLVGAITALISVLSRLGIPTGF